MNDREHISDNHIDFVYHTSVFDVESIIADSECRHKGFSVKYYADSVFQHTV